eukprot:GHVT01014284.1.p1 GENE.GHVT01014284.1~~GHVT01014284.1.p1  ORF type:complete len:238 (-),score=34.75 GHVT01014284.1:304-1017(-)
MSRATPEGGRRAQRVRRVSPSRSSSDTDSDTPQPRSKVRRTAPPPDYLAGDTSGVMAARPSRCHHTSSRPSDPPPLGLRLRPPPSFDGSAGDGPPPLRLSRAASSAAQRRPRTPVTLRHEDPSWAGHWDFMNVFALRVLIAVWSRLVTSPPQTPRHYLARSPVVSPTRALGGGGQPVPREPDDVFRYNAYAFGDATWATRCEGRQTQHEQLVGLLTSLHTRGIVPSHEYVAAAEVIY